MYESFIIHHKKYIKYSISECMVPLDYLQLYTYAKDTLYITISFNIYPHYLPSKNEMDIN
jgi:hypothetical protein